MQFVGVTLTYLIILCQFEMNTRTWTLNHQH